MEIRDWIAFGSLLFALFGGGGLLGAYLSMRDKISINTLSIVQAHKRIDESHKKIEEEGRRNEERVLELKEVVKEAVTEFRASLEKLHDKIYR